MSSLRWKIGALGAFLLVTAATAQIGPGPFSAFPTNNAADGRMLSFGCPGVATFEQGVTMGLAAPASQTSFTLSVFDGETGKTDGLGKAHWDLGTRQLVYRLYADPLRQGSTAPADLIGTWTGNAPNPTSGPLWTATAASMPDNDWWGVTVTTSAAAKAPSGNYFYNLTIDADGACTVGEVLISNIKRASTSPMNFLVPRFGLEAALHQVLNDGPIIYPGPIFPPPGGFVTAPTTYDGTFTFGFVLPGGEADLRLFDGDFDHGTNFLMASPSGIVLTPCYDADDPDTPTSYVGFPFTPAGAVPEGGLLPGFPPDDNNFDLFRRGELGDPGRLGCVRYEVTDPNGIVYRNDNPSGNLEWEQFRIASLSAFNPSDSDYVVAAPSLPGGLWTVKLIGVDMSNLNFWHANACSVSSAGGGATCPTTSVYLVGDTVWYDINGDGDQDPGEPGIPGVVLELLTDIGSPPVQTVKTGDATSPNWAACVANNTGLDSQGLYCLGVDEPGTYIVRVAASNFLPGGALAGSASTTGGGTQTNTVGDDNVLTYDFGYRGSGSIGDYVWFDTNGDGIQNDGANAGLGGVKVTLAADFDGNGTIDWTTSTVTTAAGAYTFTNLPAGTYRVSVDPATLPEGVSPSFDLDGVATANTATLVLPGGATNFTVDFGYTFGAMGASGGIGDQVWVDADGDGVIDAFELGLNGVTVQLAGDIDNDGVPEFTITDVTMTLAGVSGLYGFSGLPVGSYKVTVVTGTLPSGYLQTYDLDGLATPHAASVQILDAETILTVDFGYRPRVAPGTGTPGYWKNHPEAWPVDQIIIGGVIYTKQEAIYWMSQDDALDKTITLFRALVSAKLNVGIGNTPTCIAAAILTADQWMATYGPVGSKVAASSAAWRLGEPLYLRLDAYNNGRLCAPSRG